MDERACKRCGEERVASDFVVNRSAASGGNICRPCRRKRDGERRAANREKFRADWRKWSDANPGRSREHSRAADAKLRSEVLAAYGGHCECCGEQEQAFLTLDHVNGGGTQHRRRVHGKVYAELRRLGFPRDGYRLLCWNCNWAHRLTGSCPHQQEPGRFVCVAEGASKAA